MSDPFTIGTRGSQLALAQATATEAVLAHRFPALEVRREIIRTTGDRRTDVALSEVAKVEGVFDKGVFTKELENALDDGLIDMAVHSLKDVPTVLDERFAIAAVLPRAPVRDVLVTRHGTPLHELPAGAKVGTSSVRRARQLEWLRPDVEVIDLRGNVPTRLQKLAEEMTYDAILLAEAGLIRLGYLPQEKGDAVEALHSDRAILGTLRAERLKEDEFYPAAGQGAIGFEIRATDSRARDIATAINDEATWLRVLAEREFLRLLEGGCHTPVGVFSAFVNDRLLLKARVFPDGGGVPRTSSVEGEAHRPLELALELFRTLA